MVPVTVVASNSSGSKSRGNVPVTPITTMAMRPSTTSVASASEGFTGRPFTMNPCRSGPMALATAVNVESRVDIAEVMITRHSTE